VINVKWGVTSGIIAVIISVTLGIIFGVRMADILFRAAIFFLVFLALGIGLRFLIDNFFPELLYINGGAESKLNFDPEPPAGSQVNITIGSTGEYAVPEMFRDSRDSQELGNIEDLISGHFKVRTSFDSDNYEEPPAPEQGSGGIDLTTEDDYNIKRDSFSSMPQEFASFQESEPVPEPAPSMPVEPEKPAFTPVFGGDSDDLGALPDLGSMATAFSTGFEEAETSAMPQAGGDGADSPQTYNKGNKPQPLEGDFNPQELAQGIRTVLSKDQGR